MEAEEEEAFCRSKSIHLQEQQEVLDSWKWCVKKGP